jgi:hypothetical protein
MNKSKCDPKSELAKLIEEFIESVSSNNIEIYNEFSLQHELGIFLRNKLPAFLVQFERHVDYFFEGPRVDFPKREMDIAVFSEDKLELKYAIELKYPRNGQYPEQMYSCCKDLAFLETLKNKKPGFAATALLIFVDHSLFCCAGRTDGIYGYFRNNRPNGVMPINGVINKPTGKQDDDITINGTYTVNWVEMKDKRKYAFIEACYSPVQL